MNAGAVGKALGTSLVVATLWACHDGTSPAAVNTGTIVTGINALTSTFSGNAAYQSLGILSDTFPHYGAALRANIVRSPGIALALFPSDVLGKTFAWDSAQARYVVNTSLTGAPALGVRFVLYSASPGSHTPIYPLQQLGSVDLTDESTPQLNKIGVVLKLGVTVVGQYDLAEVTTTTSRQTTVTGWLAASDGSGRVNLDLTHFTDFTDTTADRHYTLNAQSGSSAELTLHVARDGSGTSLFHVALGGNAIDFNTAFSAANDSGQVAFNGVPVAAVSGAADVLMPTFQATRGFKLSQQQQVDLGNLFVVGQTLGTTVSGLFGPAFTVFSGI